jgi:hypothetical protein
LGLFSKEKKMATITATRTPVPGFGEKAHLIKWTGLVGSTADVGDALEMPTWADRSVQVIGTFGTTTVSIQGSNDGATWVTLTDTAAGALTFTSTGLRQILQVTRYIRPSAPSGTGTALDVHLLIVRK